MSSTANLQTDTLGVPPPDPDIRHQASLTLACRARDAAELLDWLDMFGLPPCERPLRTSVGSRTRHRSHAEGAGNER